MGRVVSNDKACENYLTLSCAIWMETYEGLEHFTLISPLFFYFFLRIYKKRENGYRRYYLAL